MGLGSDRVFNVNLDVSPERQLEVGNEFKVDYTLYLPSSVSLLDKCPEVYDQGSLGSCSGFASSSFREILDKIAGKSPPRLSPLYIYYEERLAEKTVGQDAGAQIVDSMACLLHQGVCPIDLDPYDINTFKSPPSPQAVTAAAQYKLVSATHLHSIQAMMQCLASGYPFIGGIGVYESFESEEVARTGIIPMPAPTEACKGGHAICFVGYDSLSKKFLVRNSWSPEWGDKGYFHLDFDYVNKYGSDFWTGRA